MKVYESNDLTKQIEQSLREKCNSRSLDNEEDLQAVVEVIDSIVNQWLENRCAGCR